MEGLGLSRPLLGIGYFKIGYLTANEPNWYYLAIVEEEVDGGFLLIFPSESSVFVPSASLLPAVPDMEIGRT